MVGQKAAKPPNQGQAPPSRLVSRTVIVVASSMAKPWQTEPEALNRSPLDHRCSSPLCPQVRHILCEKHARITEALAKLKAAYYPEDGAKPASGLAKWNEIASAYSEDKAKSGVCFFKEWYHRVISCSATDELLIF